MGYSAGKVLTVLFFIALFAGIYWAVYWSTSSVGPSPISGDLIPEKLAVRTVDVAADSVCVENFRPDEIAVVGFAVKDPSGAVIAQGDLACKAQDLSEGTIALNTDLSALPAGSYSVTLVTAKGGNFVSPLFTVP